ncbi:MAG: DNA mismatch repair endonuclease MutL [Sphaerochaetaceae bacterium]|nr:DNA mismatch repair endonuclease MutL [Sphaerochaetaceae bacterium]
MEEAKRIQILDPLVAQRIAAGEVIDRPASIVRELIDNSIDAHSSSITVELTDGGIEKIIVVDDGIGIREEDLPLCAQSHATSKVSSLEDLQHLATMGFRGEALYSIAAGATLSISSTSSGSLGSTVVVDNGKIEEIKPGGPAKGTVITVKQLFAHIPARRMFLKQPSSEARMCKVAMIEKAAAFPHISFSMFHNGKETLHLPPATSKQRILDILKNDRSIVPSEMIEMRLQGKSFSLYAVASRESTYRTDRSQIKIYVNNRIVDEYSMVQAITYGYDPFLPGGGFPYCYLFIQDDPKLVDFNIHPAKREVKLRNKAEIHHEVVLMVKENLQSYHQSSFASPFDLPRQSPQLFSDIRPDAKVSERPSPDWFEKAKELFQKEEAEPVSIQREVDTFRFRYIGQLFKVFLIVEKEESLYLIDQHAAHERILYDSMKIIEGSQPLMIPYEFEVERSIDHFLSDHSIWYEQFGIRLERTGDLQWAITAMIPHYKSMENEVVQAIQNYEGNNIDDLQKTLFSTAACKKAIKAGDPIDPSSAEELIKKVFELEYPVCPHGRNFVVEITREDLYSAVGRLV